MLNRARARGTRPWLVALLFAAALVPFGTTNASAVTSAQCDARVNDTPAKLLPCIKSADLWNHMQNFQAIADANPSPVDGMPSRNSGEPGYKASVDYVAKIMRDANYTGYVSLEFEGKEDPLTAIPKSLDLLRGAFA